MNEENGKEIHLDSLVDKLHSEGVDKAKASAAQIIEEAETQAATTRKKAEEEALAIVDKAREQAKEFEENANASVKLAARDTLLALNKSVLDLFNKAFKNRIADTLDDPAFLRDLIDSLVKDWANGKGVTIAIGPDAGEKLLSLAKAGTAEALSDGVDIKLNRNITNGFRIRLEGDEVAYDFSDESIAEALKTHLNPQLVKLLEL